MLCMVQRRHPTCFVYALPINWVNASFLSFYKQFFTFAILTNQL